MRSAPISSKRSLFCSKCGSRNGGHRGVSGAPQTLTFDVLILNGLGWDLLIGFLKILFFDRILVFLQLAEFRLQNDGILDLRPEIASQIGLFSDTEIVSNFKMVVLCCQKELRVQL